MANDVYIKFGESDLRGGPLNTYLPDIEGDSTDAYHYWWCELRECGFDMDTPEQLDEQAAQTDTHQPASGFKSVTLRKRVDWASTQLFLKCCQAAMATVTKSTDDKGVGRIDQVTVEVCRPAGGKKIPCVTITYFGVRITRYAIAISEPEPSESITFEFDKLKFKYIQTDPATGEVVDEAGVETSELENHHPQEPAVAANSPAASADASGAGGAAGGSAPSGTPSLTAAPGTAAVAPAAPGSSPDPTVNVNFPGLWQGTGFGLLPD